MSENGNGSERDLSKIIERIQKLLALTESANEHEAGVAAAKAAELLAKYELSMATVEGHFRPEPLEIVEDNIGWVGNKGRRTTWEVSLSSAVARANRCRTLISRMRLYFVGPASNVKVAEYMHVQLATRISILATEATKAHIAKCKAAWEQEGYDPKTFHHTKIGMVFGREHTTRAYRNSWIQGAVVGIAEQLHNQQKEFEQSSANAKALVIYSDKALEEFMKQYGKGTWRGGSSHGAGWRSGYSAGLNMSIHSGLTGGSASPKLGR